MNPPKSLAHRKKKDVFSWEPFSLFSSLFFFSFSKLRPIKHGIYPTGTTPPRIRWMKDSVNIRSSLVEPCCPAVSPVLLCVCIIFEIITYTTTSQCAKDGDGGAPGCLYIIHRERKKKEKEEKLKFSVTVPSIPLADISSPPAPNAQPWIIYTYPKKEKKIFFRH
jgi:hypothetical protein